MEAEVKRERQRAASEHWKANNYQYWILQKRALSSRPSYKAHRRRKYKEKMDSLKAAEGYVPPIRGRPRLYSPTEAAQRRRKTAREWAAAHRLAKDIISGKENYLHDNTATTSEEVH